jgi:hypothetical protein
MEYSMRKNGVRVLLVLASLLSVAALVIDYRFDNQMAELRAAMTHAERGLADIETTAAELRAAQNAYVAAGQGHGFWIDRVTELTRRITNDLSLMRETVTSAEARTRLDAASTALAELLTVDDRARQHVTDDQRLLASDVIFVDAVASAQKFGSEVASARAAEAAFVDGALTALRNNRLGVNAATTVLVLLVALGALRLNRQAPASAAASMAQMIRDLPPPVKTAPLPLPTPAPAPVVTVRPAPPSPAPAPVVNLPEAAELCVDLARVIDGRDIPALLERTARLIEARGLIVWVADAEGATLRPMLTHGYAEKVINRLGTLEAGADNVTSLSFRSLRPQLMNGGTDGSSGALAVPLVTASGCTGVLAAEIKEGRPAPEVLAVARIVAAQLATLIAPYEIAAPQAAAEA